MTGYQDSCPSNGCRTTLPINTLKPRQNGHRLADNTFKGILFNENVGIVNTISLKFVPKGLIDDKTSLAQVMAW